MTGLITSLGFTSSSEQVWRGTYWHSLAIVSEGYSLTMSLQTSFGTSWQYSWNLYKHTLMTNKFKVHTIFIYFSPDPKTKSKIETFYICLWHQTTKPPILFSTIFSTNFSQLQQLKKKTNSLLVQNMFFLGFGPMKSLFSFSTAEAEKN